MIQIVTLVRRALAEVCTIPVFLVIIIIINNELIIVTPNIKNVASSLYKVTCVWVCSWVSTN